MSNDRELLELAAKAAGLKVSPIRQEMRDADGFGHVGLWIHGVSTCWNPLSDDSDAFRLAVNIGLIVNAPSPIGEYAIVRFYDIDIWERVADCRYAATRRAIVRAAAAMAKTTA